MRYLFSQHHRWSHTLGLGLTWNWHYTRRKGEVCRFGGYNSSQTQYCIINALPGTYHPKNTFMQFTHTTSFYWKGFRLKCWKIPFDPKNVNRAIDGQRKLTENFIDCLINSVSADSMALLLIMVYTSTVTTLYRFVYTRNRLFVNIGMVTIVRAEAGSYRMLQTI